MKSYINWIKAANQYRKKSTVCKTMPVRIWIEPTSFCNLQCKMCPNKDMDKKEKGFMDIDLYEKIIDEAKAFSPSINLFLRGEPLMHPRIMDIISYAKKNRIATRMESNGGLLTKERADQLLENPPDFMSFSFDGYDKETYESLRVGGNFEKILENILYFLRKKKRLGLKKPFTFFQVISMPAVKKSEKNKKEKLIRKLKGLTKFRFVTPHRFGGKIDEDVTGNKYAYTTHEDVEYTPCPYPWTTFNIYWNGDVVPCCIDFHSGFILGSVKDHSISEIWNNQKYQRLRKKLATKNHKDIELCSDCDFLWSKKIFGIPEKNIKDFVQMVKEMF
ncbi:radical SAM protein [Candidatus Woesearchaeota archaeon]|nr:radical SAM protein [Candidatus Woesearchaeota archaeon]